MQSLWSFVEEYGMEEEEMTSHRELGTYGRKKSRGYGEEEDYKVLDSKMWAKLPDSILCTVFQFLSWEDVFRCRAVGMEWNSYLRSPTFKMAWQKDPDQVPICFASSNDVNSYFNPATNRWHICGVDLPPSLCGAGNDISKDVSKITRGRRRFPIVSAAKGFLLIQMYTSDASPDDVTLGDTVGDATTTITTADEPTDVRDDFMMYYNVEDDRTLATAVVDAAGADDGSHQGDEDLTVQNHNSIREMLLIVNPLEPPRKAYIKAVPYLQDNYCQHEIIWDPKLRTYELLARSADISRYRRNGNCVWSIIFHRYNFSTGEWIKIVTWSTHRFISLESSCLIGGQLVCLGRPATLRSVNTKPYRIYGMQLSESLSIEEMEATAPRLPFSLGFAILFYYDGMYVLAGGDVSAKCSTLRSFKVWKKHELFCAEDGVYDNEWIEVIQMPNHFLRELNNCVYRSRFTCKADGRFLCVSNRSTDVVMCDLERELWWKLPPHPFGKDGASEGLVLCDPRFDVMLES